MSQAAECFICRKHRGGIGAPGGAVHEDALVYVGHAAIGEDDSLPLLGHCLVEPLRHVASIADLTPDEAQAVGLQVSRTGRAIRELSEAEQLYVFVLGHHAPHLHIHVLPRYPGTPREYWGLRVDEWPGAPKGDEHVISEFVQQMRDLLSKEGF